LFSFLFILLALADVSAWAQRGNRTESGITSTFHYPKSERKERYQIAVISPLYLDSVDLEKNLTRIPKFMMPGLDFYKGIQIAADTLKQLGCQLDIHVYDSKSDSLPLSELIRLKVLDTMDLILTSVSGNEIKVLADFGREHEINVVSALSPADGGQDQNPYFTLLQPRLVSHIEKLHRSVTYRYPEDNVVFIYRKQSAEKNALNYFKQDMLYQIPKRFTEMELSGDVLDPDELIRSIDTTYTSTVILGILDASVAYKNLKVLQTLAARLSLKVYGMPTLETLKALGKTDEFPGMPIFYTCPYIIDKITPASSYINQQYKLHMGGHPGDVVYKGFECLYYFANLLKRYGVPFNEHLNESAYNFIMPYKIMPVKEKGKIRFYENKYLYLLRYENGIMTYE